MARNRVLGLPIGKRKRPRYEVAKKVGTALVMVAPAVAVPAARKIGRVTHEAGDLLDAAPDVAEKVSDIAQTASDVKTAVSSHSTTVGKAAGLISALVKARKGSQDGKPKLSRLIEQHVDIAVPRSVVYNQWTQFEMFPRLTKGIESVSQEEPDKVQWTAKIGPSSRTWTGKIVEQIPDERVAWESEGGVSLQGVVTFHSLDEDLTRVLLQMEYKPSGAVEWVGNTLRSQRRRVKRDLRLFKHFIEMRGEETGAWRGRIDAKEPMQPQFAGQGRTDSQRARPGQRRSGSSQARSHNGRRTAKSRA